MKKIYCISTGSYSDWEICYSFKNKDKRDLLLKTLGDNYDEYDIELDDDRIGMEDIKDIYTVCLYKSNVFIAKEDPIDFKIRKHILISRGSLYSIFKTITKEEFELGKEYCENKYRKVWYDTEAKIKYMHEIDGIGYDEIEELLNKEMF